MSSGEEIEAVLDILLFCHSRQRTLDYRSYTVRFQAEFSSAVSIRDGGQLVGSMIRRGIINSNLDPNFFSLPNLIEVPTGIDVPTGIEVPTGAIYPGHVALSTLIRSRSPGSAGSFGPIARRQTGYACSVIF